MKKLFDEELLQQLTDRGITVERDVSGKSMSTFKSGGFIDYVIYPQSVEEAVYALDKLEGYEYHILGCGSNSLISDNGLKVVLSTKRIRGYTLDGEELSVNCGERLTTICNLLLENSLSGLEFAVGIPATVGGGICSNVGAFGEDISGVLKSVTLYCDGKLVEKTPTELKMGYRTTSLKGGVVLKCVLLLKRGSKELIEKRMNENLAYRRNTQPNAPSVGSVFKRVNGVSPAVYIQGVGLKGARIGNAQVSGIHCNFIINLGGSATRDYLRLVDMVKSKVYDRYGIVLENEVRLIKDTLR